MPTTKESINQISRILGSKDEQIFPHFQEFFSCVKWLFLSSILGCFDIFSISWSSKYTSFILDIPNLGLILKNWYLHPYFLKLLKTSWRIESFMEQKNGQIEFLRTNQFTLFFHQPKPNFLEYFLLIERMFNVRVGWFISLEESSAYVYIQYTIFSMKYGGQHSHTRRKSSVPRW